VHGYHPYSVPAFTVNIVLSAVWATNYSQQHCICAPHHCLSLRWVGECDGRTKFWVFWTGNCAGH